MDSKPISLTKSEQALARDFGDRMAAALRDPKSQANAASARLSSHGINAAMMGLGKLAEVAATCAWLALGNTLVTGQTIVLDGAL